MSQQVHTVLLIEPDDSDFTHVVGVYTTQEKLDEAVRILKKSRDVANGYELSVQTIELDVAVDINKYEEDDEEDDDE